MSSTDAWQHPGHLVVVICGYMMVYVVNFSSFKSVLMISNYFISFLVSLGLLIGCGCVMVTCSVNLDESLDGNHQYQYYC